MRTTTMASAALLPLLLAGSAAAQTTPAQTTPAQAPAAAAVAASSGLPPAPALDAGPFRFLVGRWRGAGTFFNGTTVASTVSFELASRTTMVVRGEEDAPNTYRYVGLWSREKGSGELLMLLSSSLDGPALYRSAGWVGDRLVFEPKAGVETGPSRVRFTYLRRGAETFDLTYEFSVGDKWVVGDRQTFKKAE